MKDKRKGKLDRHFPILINGHKVKILSCRIEAQGGHKYLTLKTLIHSPWLKGGLAGRTCRISIGTKETLQNLRCHCCAASCGPPPWTYRFDILNEGDTVSYGEIISPDPVVPAENS